MHGLEVCSNVYLGHGCVGKLCSRALSMDVSIGPDGALLAWGHDEALIVQDGKRAYNLRQKKTHKWSLTRRPDTNGYTMGPEIVQRKLFFFLMPRAQIRTSQRITNGPKGPGEWWPTGTHN